MFKRFSPLSIQLAAQGIVQEEYRFIRADQRRTREKEGIESARPQPRHPRCPRYPRFICLLTLRPRIRAPPETEMGLGMRPKKPRIHL